MSKFIKAGALIALAALAACSNQTEEPISTTMTVPDEAIPSGPVTQGTLGPADIFAEDSADYFEQVVGNQIYFATDSSSLDIGAQTTLTFQADWLLRYPNVTVLIEGHADERGTREYNLALGARRANAVYDYLISMGVAPNRLQTVTFGKERPVALCSAESCWSQNRRGLSAVSGTGS